MPKKQSRTSAEFVTSLERGLRVLQTFSREHAQLTLSEVAALTELSAATARRSLHTLEILGYVGRDGRRFLLRPRVLAISAGYLGAINTTVVLQPFLQEVVGEVGGSASVTILDELEIVYLARASATGALRVTASVGTRYPAYPTAMGRVLLAYQPDWALDAYFRRATFQKLTEFTETSPVALRDILRDVRANGFASIQDELDYGIASVALPIFGRSGRIVASASCSDVTSRSDKAAMVARRLPVLQQAVRRIESMLAQHPELESSVESVMSDSVQPRSVARIVREPGRPRSPLRVASRPARRRG